MMKLPQGPRKLSSSVLVATAVLIGSLVPQGELAWAQESRSTSETPSSETRTLLPQLPLSISEKYTRSHSPGKIRIANTVPRSNCGQTFGTEKCRLTDYTPLDASGDVTLEAVTDLKRVLNFPIDPKQAQAIQLPELLVRLLVNVSDTFAGAQLCVVSGYRCKECHAFQKASSRHITGHAVDVVLLGIDNVDLASYALFLNDSHPDFKNRLGVGFYPNQEHVHLDVREKGKYWIDISAAGVDPVYDSSHPSPSDAHRLHYDPRIAPSNPGGQCPVLGTASDSESEPQLPPRPRRYQWRNVLYTQPPLRGSAVSRQLFDVKSVNFAPLPQLGDLRQLR